MIQSGNTKESPVLNIGIIGLGGGASDMIPAFVRHPHTRIVAAADIDKGQLDRFQSEFQGETYLTAEGLCKSPNVDVVYVATPNQFHTEHTLMALENRKHVLVEKPMTLTLEEAELMIKAADRNGLWLTVNVKHSFGPRIRKLREMVLGGELGKLRMLHFWYFSDWLYTPRTAEEINPNLGGGVPWRQGPHQIDILRTIGGGLVRSVRAMTGVWDESRPVAGCYSAYLEFEDRTVATAVYSGYDHFNSKEFTYKLDQGVDWADPPVHARARRTLRQAGSAEAETALKRSRRFGGAARTELASRGGSSQWVLGGPLIVSFDKGDVRLTPNGVMVYGDEEKWEIPVAKDRDGRDGIIDQLYQAVVDGRRPANDGLWGKATLEVLLALFQSSRERKEVFLSHQIPTID